MFYFLLRSTFVPSSFASIAQKLGGKKAQKWSKNKTTEKFQKAQKLLSVFFGN